jgi:hypothetical protein
MSANTQFTPPEKLYKYRSLNTKEEQGWVREILLENCLYFPSRLQVNDPFDCRIPLVWNRSTPKQWRDKLTETYSIMPPPGNWTGNVKGYVGFLLENGAIQKMKRDGPTAEKAILDNFRFVCLCERRDNILMWSHYADYHRGICLEFRVLKKSFFSAAIPVEYGLDCPVLKATLPQKELADGMIRTKAPLWKHEQEWRVGKREAAARYLFRPECLTGVILGCQISPDNEALITEWLTKRTSRATLYRAMKAQSKFALEIKRIKVINPG